MKNAVPSQATVEELHQRLTELARSKSRQELMNRLLVSLSSVAGLENMTQHILNILMQTIGANNIAIIFKQDEVWQYRDIYGAIQIYHREDTHDVDKVLKNGHALKVSAPNLETMPTAEKNNSCAENWFFPLKAQEQIIGVVCMEGMLLNDQTIFDELQPFFVYAGLMLGNEMSSYARLMDAHRRLQDSETLYRTLFDQSPDGIVLWSVPDLRAIQFNKAAHEILGYSRQDFAKLGVKDIHLGKDPNEVNNLLDQLQQAGLAVFEANHLTQNGEQRVMLISLKMLEIGKQQMILAIHRDMTERKQAEEKMALLTFALNQISEAVYLADENACFKFVNEEACRALGYSEDEFLTMSVPDITGDIPAESWPEHWNTLKETGPLQFEAIHNSKDGLKIPVEITVNYFEFNGAEYNLALARDLTEQKRDEEEKINLEKQMMHTQKLESLGVLAGGIAHDFNNLLASIVGHAELSKRRISADSPALDNLKQIEKSAERAADLAKQMLAYSGKGKFVVEKIDLNVLLDEMLHMLQVSISKKAILRLNPYPSLPSVEADATQLRQIVMNLVINASEAIGDKSGVISISTGCMDCDKKYLKNVWLDENLSEGLYVYLEVADTGCGMDKITLDRLFDPFFTTKFTGRGLGMSATLGIVRGHKGAIRIYSEVGKGTSFKILFPASDLPVEIFNNAPEEGTWTGGGKILLVDDEESVRGIGIAMLKELGFTPLTAEDGREALHLYREHSDIALVILDLTMPHMDGEQCYRELRQLSPDVKVIMSSGYNEYEVTQKFIGKGLCGFLQKPYKLSVLRETLQNALN